MSDEDKPRAKPIPERWADALRAEGLPGGLAQIGFGFVVVAAILLLGLVARFAFLVLDPTEAMDHEALRNLALVLAGLVGLPFLGWRSWAAHRQAAAAHRQSETALQTNITTRINEAVKMLGAEKSVKATERHTIWRRAPDGATARDPDGDPLPELDAEHAPLTEYRTVERTEPNLEVRLGALYALERIAQDSLRDHVPIMETLCAYIRENSENLEELARPRIDILTALTILGRRGPDQRAQEAKRVPSYRPDLGGAKFERNDLSGLALQGMLFVRAKMEGVNLSGSRLEGANFRMAILAGANFSVANLEKVDFLEAQMSGALLHHVKLSGCRFDFANIFGAAIKSIENFEFIYLDSEGATNIFADGTVKLAIEDESARPLHWLVKSLNTKDFLGRWRDWRAKNGLPWPPPGGAIAGLAGFDAIDWDSPVPDYTVIFKGTWKGSSQ